jgi:2-polyprenyl-3-methyl-5-hydroxy-6-metoxy-1,4-benzoquinol methylase
VLLFNYSTLVEPILKDVRICVAGLSDIKAGHRVLDVACGTGDQVFQYEQKGAIATGVDQNPNVIQQGDMTWVYKPVRSRIVSSSNTGIIYPCLFY